MFYECRHCNKLFKKETAFVKHNCKERQRHHELGEINGQIAFGLYERWIYLRHGKNPEIDTFKVSRFYNSFIAFAKYYKAIKGLSHLDEFLLLMIKKDIQPCNWLNDKVLAFYFSEVDNMHPIDKVKKTIETIINICDAYECDTSECFDYIEFDVMLNFIKLHKLSPWILLNSKKFIKWVSELPWEQQYIMDTSIDSDRWKSTFEKDRINVSFAKKCIKELEL